MWWPEPPPSPSLSRVSPLSACLVAFLCLDFYLTNIWANKLTFWGIHGWLCRCRLYLQPSPGLWRWGMGVFPQSVHRLCLTPVVPSSSGTLRPSPALWMYQPTPFTFWIFQNFRNFVKAFFFLCNFSSSLPPEMAISFYILSHFPFLPSIGLFQVIIW